VEDIGSRSGARAVSVLYTGGQLFTQNSAGVPSSGEQADLFGRAPAVGDPDLSAASDSSSEPGSCAGKRRVANQAPAAVELQNTMTVRCSRKVALLSIGSLPITGIDHFRITTFCSSRLGFSSGTATRTRHNP
jgi:hypothetical protein